MTHRLDNGYTVRTIVSPKSSAWELLDPSGEVIASGYGDIYRLI